ncbi:hypothetical protein NLG97_g4781 [Lecanicillium saksenae]|uniref:Uncharacterized protein n=1 Tax=Lecanicillium saksenae TaxID=468837 RepID=A0ACC1QUB1_9HYPO|nr:hypothetical protein NLG97_g4781 [Lecanicillium saksenae]
MKFTTIITMAAWLGYGAGLALDIPTPTIVVTAGVLPHPAQITKSVEKRDGLNETCVRSVYSQAFSSSISNQELRAALESALSANGASTAPRKRNLCTVTMASSLSSEYVSYLSAAKSRYASATNFLKNIHTDCGGPVFQISIQPLCAQKSLTAVFTGLSGPPKTTALPPVPPGSGVSIDVGRGSLNMINLESDDKQSEAPELSTALGSVMAIAVVAAAAMML